MNNSSSKITRVGCEKGLVYKLSKGNSEKLSQRRSTQNSPVQRQSETSDDNSSNSDSGKRSLRTSAASRSFALGDEISKKLENGNGKLDPNECGWTWGGVGRKKVLSLVAPNVPWWHILAFKIKYKRHKTEEIKASRETPSNTSSTDSGEDDAVDYSEDEDANEYMRVGFAGGKTIAITTQELERVFKPSFKDRFEVRCLLVRATDKKPVLQIGSRMLMKSLEDNGKCVWTMLESSEQNLVKVTDTGHGYSIQSVGSYSENFSLFVIQRITFLNKSELRIVGRSKDRNINIYRRPLDSKYDINSKGTFQVLLVHDHLEDPNDIMASIGTGVARPLYSGSIPFGHRLCFSPVFFKLKQEAHGPTLRIIPLDPAYANLIFVVFEKKTAVHDELQNDMDDGEFTKEEIEQRRSNSSANHSSEDFVQIGTFSSDEKRTVINLLPRRRDCFHKKYIIRAYLNNGKEHEIDEHVASFYIPANLTCSEDIDYDPKCAESSPDSDEDDKAPTDDCYQDFEM